MAVSHQPSVNQCAEMHKMSCGLGHFMPNSAPRACQLRRYSLSSIAFMGLPWPRKMAGILTDNFRDLSKSKAPGLAISVIKSFKKEPQQSIQSNRGRNMVAWQHVRPETQVASIRSVVGLC